VQPYLYIAKKYREETMKLYVGCSKTDKEKVKEASKGSARWNGKSKLWVLPADPLMVKRLKEYLPNIEINSNTEEWLNQIVERQKALNDAVVNNTPLNEGNKLYPFQCAAVRALIIAGSLILGDEMGLGKTPVGCSAIKLSGAKKIIIICPNQVKWSWVEHLREWAGINEAYLVEANKTISSEAVVIWKEREAHISRILQKDNFVMIMGFEMMKKYINNLTYGKYDLIIYDEAHRLKNRNAIVTKRAKQLSACSQRSWLLTGTPVRNRPDDLFTLLSIVDPKRFSDYWDFVNLHMHCYHEYNHVVLGGVADAEVFNSMISAYMVRRTKAEVMPELPEKIYTTLKIPLLPEQEELYRTMEEEFIVSIRNEMIDGTYENVILSASNTLAMMMRLRQICLSPSLLGDKITESAKIELLKELLDDLHQQEQKTIIFTYFRSFIPEVEEILKNIGVNYGVIKGGQSPKARHQLQLALKSGEIEMIVGTAQSMGEGMNLQAATTAVFCDYDWVPANNQQAEDRIHRSGIKDSPNIISLYHPNTIEEDILVTCSQKKGLIEESIGQTETMRAMLLRHKII